ncbi:MAG: CotH kinase family protein [Chitinophagales bacterium]
MRSKYFFTVVSVSLLFFTLPMYSQPYLPVQGKVYTDSIIPRIDIFMDPDSLEIMYNDLYTETEYTATFIWNDGITIDTVDNIGIRIRGNTSQVSAKKSFKIDFNQFVPGRKFYGFEKLHLNGEHNDPCITRSKLYWDILKSMRVPGPRANHIDLYINGNYFGLYVNVEEIDEYFVQSRFANNNGNLYKCLLPHE